MRPHFVPVSQAFRRFFPDLNHDSPDIVWDRVSRAHIRGTEWLTRVPRQGLILHRINNLGGFDWLLPCTTVSEYELPSFPISESRVRLYGAKTETTETGGPQRTP